MRLLPNAEHFLAARFLPDIGRLLELEPGGAAYGKKSSYMKVLRSDRGLEDLRAKNYSMLRQRAMYFSTAY